MTAIALTRDEFRNAVEYNRKKNGTLWDAEDLPWPFSVHAGKGNSEMESDLVYLLLVYQDAHDGLDVDGKLGPATLRRLRTENDFDNDREAVVAEAPEGIKGLLFNERRIGIEWDKVVLPDDEGGFKCEPGSYTEVDGSEDRDVRLLVVHWDATLSTSRMAAIIAKRNLSMHFGIDNDGTIYQLLDMQQHAWQAGHSYANKHGVGVEISNAYYPKYQEWYERNGYGKRPLMTDVRVHGHRLSPFLGFYPVQLDALKALVLALHKGLGMPLVCPVDSSERMIGGVYDDANDFRGVLHHFHLLRGKIDCAGLDLVEILDRAKRDLSVVP